MIDTLRLTAYEAAELLRTKEISGAELWEAYRRAIDERDGDLHCFLHVCDDPGGDGIPLVFVPFELLRTPQQFAVLVNCCALMTTSSGSSHLRRAT